MIPLKGGAPKSASGFRTASLLCLSSETAGDTSPTINNVCGAIRIPGAVFGPSSFGPLFLIFRNALARESPGICILVRAVRFAFQTRSIYNIWFANPPIRDIRPMWNRPNRPARPLLLPLCPRWKPDLELKSQKIVSISQCRPPV